MTLKRVEEKEKKRKIKSTPLKSNSRLRHLIGYTVARRTMPSSSDYNDDRHKKEEITRRDRRKVNYSEFSMDRCFPDECSVLAL